MLKTLLERARVTIGGFAWHVGLGRRNSRVPVDSRARLLEFIDSHASHVAQTSLYGYLKARAGTRFVELFESPEFLVSINYAKWQVWTATLSDLAVYAGGLLHNRSGVSKAEVDSLMRGIIEEILARTGTPDDSGPDFGAAVGRLRARIETCDFSRVADDAGSFTESPEALVTFAPVVDEFKRLDAHIVRNSVRFRWIEVRRTLRSLLDANAIMEECTPSPADSTRDRD